MKKHYEGIVFISNHNLKKKTRSKVSELFNLIKIDSDFKKFNHKGTESKLESIRAQLKDSKAEKISIDGKEYDRSTYLFILVVNNDDLTSYAVHKIFSKVPGKYWHPYKFKNKSIIYVKESFLQGLSYYDAHKKNHRPFLVLWQQSSMGGVILLPISSKINGDGVDKTTLRSSKRTFIPTTTEVIKNSVFKLDRAKTLGSEVRRMPWLFHPTNITINKLDSDNIIAGYEDLLKRMTKKWK